MKKRQLLTILLCISVLSYSSVYGQKYVPPEGHALFIIGQDLGAIGGFEAPNNDGYSDHFIFTGGGVTSYTSLNNLGGLKSLTNYGAGDVCAQCIVENPLYKNAALSIGLYLVNQLDDVIAGKLDRKIKELAKWIISTDRPVYLRIGYEFNLSFNNYSPSRYKEAYNRIASGLIDAGVKNVAFVWQSEGSGSVSHLMQWYPGDEYVDWLGYSHFDNKGEGILEIAEQKNKPVMIAEATPRRDLKAEDGEKLWNEWYGPLFDHISKNPSIKALAYINVNWDSQSMWRGQGWGDSRIQVNEYIRERWEEEINSDYWLKASDSLFNKLGYLPVK